MKPIAVIPARFAATRFPGKPLALLLGKPMIQHVYQRCVESGAFGEVVVATEDDRIAHAVAAFGGRCELTRPDCASGTDRVAEVAMRHESPDDTVFVNVQGDEPAIHPHSLQALVRTFDEPSVQMATLIRPLEEEERQNPNVVKVVLSQAHRALYFSRADIPFQRDGGAPPPRYAHLGIYGYRKATLRRLSALAPTPLEQAESLEQLRALENHIDIVCARTPHKTCAVDRPGDVSLAERALSALLGPGAA